MNNANTIATSSTYNNGTAHKVLGAIAAVAVTLILQGTLLAGFDHLAIRKFWNYQTAQEFGL